MVEVPEELRTKLKWISP